MNLFILSTGRAASTSLYFFLDKLFHLNLPSIKEPHFLIDTDFYDNKPKILSDLKVRSLEDYQKLYKNSKIIVDASVGYFFNIDEFLENLKKYNLNENSKIIYIFREPADRSKSLFIKQYLTGFEKGTNFKKAFNRKCNDKKYWWSYNYDNVNYNDNFIKLKNNFNEILLINYNFFNSIIKNNNKIFSDFLSLSVQNEAIPEKKKINSSDINNFFNKENFLNFLKKKGKFSKLLFLFKYYFKSIKVIILKIRIKNFSDDDYFENSKKQYKSFMNNIEKFKIYEGVYKINNK